MLPTNTGAVHSSDPQISSLAYRRGYSTPKSMRSVIAAAHRTRLGLTLATVLTDHLLALAAAFASSWILLDVSVPLGLITCVLAVFVVARQLRALECLVHEGSHYNWTRSHRRTNDILAFVLAGMPTGARISDYRTSHLLHHGRFGTGQDPDRQRYQQLDLESLGSGSVHNLLINLVQRLPRYQLGWLQALRSNPIYFVLPLLWACLTGVPEALILGTGAGLVAAAEWLAALLLVLPVIRLVGEASEHVYSDSETVFDATISNLGPVQRLVLHPHNDGYHTVHHLWPGVPHHNLRSLHEALLAYDPDQYGSRLRIRMRAFQRPQRGVGRFRDGPS